jgi:DNA polymerase delta subunit 4
VTKATVNAQQSKLSKKDPALLDLVPAQEKMQDAEPTTADAAIEEQVQAEIQHEAEADPLQTTGNKTEEVLGGRAQESEIGALGGKGNGWVDDEEARAKKTTHSQVKAYWRAKEQERKAPRVHQEGLTVGEKVLREFDMSGQFGVSTSPLTV